MTEYVTAEYMLCKVESMDDGSDGPQFQTIGWGYNTAAEAFRELDKLNKAGDRKAEDMAVLAIIDRVEDE